eukprot:9147365-Pyramimonas_sp.AAC.1
MLGAFAHCVAPSMSRLTPTLLPPPPTCALCPWLRARLGGGRGSRTGRVGVGRGAGIGRRWCVERCRCTAT